MATVLLAGATGLVGREVLRLVDADGHGGRGALHGLPLAVKHVASLRHVEALAIAMRPRTSYESPEALAAVDVTYVIGDVARRLRCLGGGPRRHVE